VERLHAAAEELGGLGDLLDASDVKALLRQKRGGAAR
jgi:hypothetical protein